MLANSQAAHRLGLIAAQSLRYSQALFQAEFSAAAASTAKSTYNVPEGHHNSDLSSTACHIGLGRRRDLTMRQDLRLWDGDKPLTLAEVFHVSGWGCGAVGLVPLVDAVGGLAGQAGRVVASQLSRAHKDQ